MLGEVLERKRTRRRNFPQLGRNSKKCAKPRLRPAICAFACVCICHFSRTYLPGKLEICVSMGPAGLIDL